MNIIYLLTGGNVGDRSANLKTAIYLISKQIGSVTKRSSVYETDAWGNTTQPDFLNQVLSVETIFDAAECMQKIFFIENKMGRVRDKKNDPRIIDIDILFFNDEIINEVNLTVPHPQIQNRKFVLIPMNEIAADLTHPVLKKTINNLLSTCPDTLEVRLLSQR